MNCRAPLLLLAAALGWAPSHAPAEPVVQQFAAPTTVSLRLGAPIVAPGPSPAVRKAPSLPMPTESQVVGETSVPQNMVMPPELPGAEPTPSDRPDPTPAARRAPRNNAAVVREAVPLPEKIDRTSTEGIAQQLARFEQKNQMAEAALLANQLIALDPASEIGWETAVRTALVQARAEDALSLCSAAIAAGQNATKYYVLQAHILQRAGEKDKLKKLLDQLAKPPVRDRMMLARVASVAGDDAVLRFALEGLSAGEQYEGAYPVSLLGNRATRNSATRGKLEGILSTAEANVADPWERSALLLLSLDAGVGAKLPATLWPRLQAELTSAPTPAAAAKLADAAIDRMRDARRLNSLLAELRASRDSNGLSVWLEARVYRRTGDTTGALAKIEEQSTSPQMLIQRERAELMLAAGRGAEALPLIQGLLAQGLDDPALRVAAAERLVEDGRLREALDTLSPLVLLTLEADVQRRAAIVAARAAAPLGPKVFAAAWNELGRLREPALWLAAADTAHPLLDPDPAVRLAVREALEEQATTTTASLGSDPAATLVMLAVLDVAEGRTRPAVAKLAGLLERYPDSVELAQRMADVALSAAPSQVSLSTGVGPAAAVDLHGVDTRAIDAAVTSARRLVTLQPAMDAHLITLFRAYQARGEVETAKRVVLEIIGPTEERAGSLARAARILDDAGFPSDALPFYRRAAAEDPDDFDTWLRYAGALRAVEDVEKASAICKTILEKGFHGQPYASTAMITALYRMHVQQGTVPSFFTYADALRARSIPAKDRLALAMARVLAGEGLTDKALEWAGEGLLAAPKSAVAPELLFLQARLRFEKRDFEQAAKLFRDLADRFPSSPLTIPALYNAGDVWRQAGSPRLAIDRWIQLATKYSDNDAAISALHDAAMLAFTKLNDPLLARSLFRQIVQSNCQDYALVAAAEANIDRLDSHVSPVPYRTSIMDTPETGQ